MDAAQIERVARQLHALYKQHEHNIQSYNNRKAGMDAGNSTPFFVERLKQLLDSIHENNRKYEEAYESYYSATGDVRYDDQYKKHSKACLAMEESLVNYIDACMPQEQVIKDETMAEPKSSSGNAAMFKPFTLLHDTPMSEYRQWGVRYHSYFLAMKMQEKAADSQKALLMSCLDSTLGDIIMNSNATSTYANDQRETWLTLLEKYFEATYPMHARINKLISLQPVPGQTTSGFFREFNRLVKDASAFKCTVDVLITTIMISKCPDAHLRKELLRAPITYERAMLLGMESDAAEVASNLHNPPPSASSAAVTTSTSNSKSTQPRRPAPSSSSKPKASQCSRCNMGNHPADKCFTLSKPCPVCSKTGHSKKTCRANPSSAAQTSAVVGTSSIARGSASSQQTPTIHL